MDCRPVLETIARTLPMLPAVEDQLVTFDSLVGVSDAEHRPEAARMLRNAAAASADGGRRQRLLDAADAVAAGQPCALTPDGLSARQAAAAQTITMEEWERRGGDPVAAPSESPGFDDSDEDEEDFLDQAPPVLPHLPVRHFFDGLRVRVAQEFTDARGRVLEPGEVLAVLSVGSSQAECVLSLYVGTVRLNAGDPLHAAILENAGNSWLQPIPSLESLRALWSAADEALRAAEQDEKMERYGEWLASLRKEIDSCEVWIDPDAEGGKPPDCRTGRTAARIFGRDHPLAFWTPLLFEGLKVVSVQNAAVATEEVDEDEEFEDEE